MSVFMCLFQYRFAYNCDCVCLCVLECVCMCICLYIQTSVPHAFTREPSISDVGALGVIGGGGCWRVAASLFGIVEAIVVLVGAR